jgi:hypothetical protein
MIELSPRTVSDGRHNETRYFEGRGHLPLDTLVPKTRLPPIFSNGKGTTSVVPIYANHKAALAAEASFETVAFQIAARDVLHIFHLSETTLLDPRFSLVSPSAAKAA